VRGSVERYIDGSKVGEAYQEINNESGFIDLGEAQLEAGDHKVELCASAAPTCIPAAAAFRSPKPAPSLRSDRRRSR
jgi:hypothetical protein